MPKSPENKSVLNCVGVDTGGTFTDLVACVNGKLQVHKQLSTPHAPENAIIAGLKALGIQEKEPFLLIHGTTVGTNAVLENKGVKTAYICNHGFADLLTIGRQNRDRLYELAPEHEPPPVPPELCLEISGRLSADGSMLEPLKAADLTALKDRIRKLKPKAVAINMLFSFLRPGVEKVLAKELEEDYYVTCSADVLAERGEYERGIATWLNSYVGPIMGRYLKHLQSLLPQARLRVMQSSGKTTSAQAASRLPVHLLLSGPAGGAMAARHLGKQAGQKQVLSFDMGGTSTDVALVDSHSLRLSNEGKIGKYPLAIPMIDIRTVGAGGGSIAFIDKGGFLRAGPQSAGADPGPACYGKGGKLPTVTDANLILGRLPETLGQQLRLSLPAAKEALVPIAQTLNKTIFDCAMGVIDIVNEQMIQTLRLIATQQERAIATLMMAGFGATGGTHACALAEGLKIESVIIPAYAGVFSAYGMLLSPQGLRKTRSLCVPFEKLSEQRFQEVFASLKHSAEQEIRSQGIQKMRFRKLVDLRYLGQSHALELEYQPLVSLAEKFQEQHQKLRGYRLETPVEVVTAKVEAFAPAALDADTPCRWRKKHRAVQEKTHTGTPIHFRDAMPRNQPAIGPALVIDDVSTTWVSKNWEARTDEQANLHLSKTNGIQKHLASTL